MEKKGKPQDGGSTTELQKVLDKLASIEQKVTEHDQIIAKAFEFISSNPQIAQALGLGGGEEEPSEPTDGRMEVPEDSPYERIGAQRQVPPQRSQAPSGPGLLGALAGPAGQMIVAILDRLISFAQMAGQQSPPREAPQTSGIDEALGQISGLVGNIFNLVNNIVGLSAKSQMEIFKMYAKQMPEILKEAKAGEEG